MNTKLRWSTFAVILVLLGVSLLAVPQVSAHAASTTEVTTKQLSMNVSTNTNLDCVAGSYMQVEWWGITTRLSHCLTQELIGAQNIVSAVATGVAAFCGATIDPWCSAAVAVIAAYIWATSAYIGMVDDWCGDQGVFINQDWQGTAWVAGVC